MTGEPLSGLTVVELASLAPAPFGCMILADLGADVIRVERAGDGGSGLMAPSGVLDRGRRSIAVNLRTPEGLEAVRTLVERADILVEGFRPGVAERLGIGPDDCLSRNPGLIYGRMTGWGQDGHLAPRAGHDINYIALAGALEPIGRAGERPVPPRSTTRTSARTPALAVGVEPHFYDQLPGPEGRGFAAHVLTGC
ncbi:alpha-methylacyl-CoA racemase [Rhodococcus opacus RKJ300 = JCM 13270]|uniref:Alpha-methylacyl-CoA racemase n=1 Tax=Rhodococcus opacus RKJ300 = JCM 13270 TaxID=1165867 RepID=I0WQR9_RHOOP|nr:alpha-methylacyl-CoA racemase [Rhodococcus opacus RKJ300 = JCM 13270]